MLINLPGMHAYGKIRAVDLTPGTSGTSVGILYERSALFIRLDAFTRTESGTDPARLTPSFVYLYIEFFAGFAGMLDLFRLTGSRIVFRRFVYLFVFIFGTVSHIDPFPKSYRSGPA
jgi:hypothetical protein